MRRTVVCILLAHALSLVGVSDSAADIPVPPPTQWLLQQNVPNPFCSNPGATSIDFAVPVASHVEVVVLTRDGGSVLRTLHDGALVIGLHRILWDGKDASGAPVPEGNYPYRMRATDAQSTVLFESLRLASVMCSVPVTPDTWGRAKHRYH